MNRPVTERRQTLLDHMVEVGNNIKFSEMKLVTKKSELSDMIKDVLQQGLEGKSQILGTILVRCYVSGTHCRKKLFSGIHFVCRLFTQNKMAYLC